MRTDHHQGSRLTDDDAVRERRTIGPGFGEASGAVGPGFLIVGEQQSERRTQRADIERGETVGGECQKPLHVGGAARNEGISRLGENEWIAAPVRLSGWYDVHVTAEHQPAAIRSFGSGDD